MKYRVFKNAEEKAVFLKLRETSKEVFLNVVNREGNTLCSILSLTNEGLIRLSQFGNPDLTGLIVGLNNIPAIQAEVPKEFGVQRTENDVVIHGIGRIKIETAEKLAFNILNMCGEIRAEGRSS